MKKTFKVFSILALMIFSFYYTEKIALYVQNNSPLKKEIIVFKENNSVSSLNAQINGTEITPGINGITVNVEKSYDQMKSYNEFIENNIVYEEVKPNISLSDYPEKTIVSGNPHKKSVSLIISSNNINLEYFQKNNINYTNIKQTNFCLITEENNCLFAKQKVKPSIILDNTSFIKNIELVKSGSIILIDDNLDKMFIDVLLKHIKFYNLKIVKLDDHLSENINI